MPVIAKVVLRSLAVALPLALGGLAIAASKNLAQAPAAGEVKRPVPAVRVITLAPVELLPRVTGYGSVSPARDWRGVARIDAEVIETAPGLANGVVVPAGTVLMRLDDTDLTLSLAQIDAQLAAAAVKDETLAASRGVAEADLALSRADLERQRALADQGVATQARLDTALRAELAAKSKVVELDNQLKLSAAERAVLEAQRATLRRSLDFTAITAPYEMRVGEVSAELGQVVSRGQTLLTGEGTEAVEVAAQFSLGRLGPMVRALGGGGTVTDLKARVRLSAPGHEVVWKASVDRVGEALDPRTQSASIVVRVDAPLAQAEAGQRPPLRRNTFVEVVLMGPKRPALVAPLDAVRGGRALVVGAGEVLEPRAVTLGQVIGDLAVVTGGLAEGDQLVVTDPSIAVPGMAVKPVEDKKLAAELAATAAGKPPAASGAGDGGSGQSKGMGKGMGGGAGSGAGASE